MTNVQRVFQVIEYATKQSGKWAVETGFHLYYGGQDDKDDDAVSEAMRDSLKSSYGYKRGIDFWNNIVSESIFFFDTEEEARKFYGLFFQSPIYSSGLYAALYSPKDGHLDCNT